MTLRSDIRLRQICPVLWTGLQIAVSGSLPADRIGVDTPQRDEGDAGTSLAGLVVRVPCRASTHTSVEILGEEGVERGIGGVPVAVHSESRLVED